MGRGIIKLNDGERDYYIEWSTVVDAPVTYGISRKEMYAHRMKRGIEDLERATNEALDRTDKNGTSWSDYQKVEAEEFMRVNRAGVRETCLTSKQIIEMYCQRKGDIVGHTHDKDGPCPPRSASRKSPPKDEA